MLPIMYLILVQPEIPPNAGNVIRLCANVGAHLHLVRPLGFSLDDAALRRAGMDYRLMANVSEYDTLIEAAAVVDEGRLFALAPRRVEDEGVGGVVRFDKPQYRRRDGFVFGCESSGLPADVLKTFAPERRLYVPMLPDNRSINLSNAVAIVAMEAWRQLGYWGEG